MIIGQESQHMFRQVPAHIDASGQRVSEGRLPDGTPFVIVKGIEYFQVGQVFDCGQCFRFDPTEDGGFEGIAGGQYIKLCQDNDNTLELIGITAEDYYGFWRHYLALDDDYAKIRAEISACAAAASGSRAERDPVMENAMSCGAGIRILHQEPWETLCSFIISQNNNIPRIKKIIAAMSEKYGEPIDVGGRRFHAFPTAEALVAAGVDGLAELRTGFRAKYIYDAAVKVSDGEIDPVRIGASDFAEADETLRGIKGVGPKVSACALLFGFGKTEAFPIDVWIKRVLAKYYPDGLDIAKLGKYAGVAQQYLFYYERYFGGEV